MERSQSCSSFISNDNNNCNHVLNTMRKTTATLDIHQAFESRQIHFQQQQQQQKQLLLQKYKILGGSSDAINSIKNNVNLINFSSMRKNALQRQKSAGYMNDIDCAADTEEEEFFDDFTKQCNVHALTYNRLQQHNTSPKVKRTRPPLLKQLELNKRLQHTKMHQESHTSPSPLSTPSFSSSTSSSSASSTGIGFERRLKHEDSFDSVATSNGEISPINRRHHFATLMRGNSIHSDSSRYSSVDSLLDSRKPDPEAILINLGFGPNGTEDDILSRIPKRFLKPSQVRGIDTEAFVKRLQLANTIANQSMLGYRGLTGNPDMPPSTIVAKIMERFEVNERKKSMGSLEHTIR